MLACLLSLSENNKHFFKMRLLVYGLKYSSSTSKSSREQYCFSSLTDQVLFNSEPETLDISAQHTAETIKRDPQNMPCTHSHSLTVFYKSTLLSVTHPTSGSIA